MLILTHTKSFACFKLTLVTCYSLSIFDLCNFDFWVKTFQKSLNKMGGVQKLHGGVQKLHGGVEGVQNQKLEVFFGEVGDWFWSRWFWWDFIYPVEKCGKLCKIARVDYPKKFFHFRTSFRICKKFCKLTNFSPKSSLFRTSKKLTKNILNLFLFRKTNRNQLWEFFVFFFFFFSCKNCLYSSYNVCILNKKFRKKNFEIFFDESLS